MIKSKSSLSNDQHMDIDILNLALMSNDQELLRKSSSGNMLSFEKMCSGLDLGAPCLLSLTPLLHTLLYVSLIYLALIYTTFLSHSFASHSVVSYRRLAAGWFGRGAGGHAAQVELQCKQWERQGAARPLLERRVDARYPAAQLITAAAQLVRAMISGGGGFASLNQLLPVLIRSNYRNVLSGLNSLIFISHTYCLSLTLTLSRCLSLTLILIVSC